MFKDYYYNIFQTDLYKSICINPYNNRSRHINVGDVIWIDVSELVDLRLNSLIKNRETYVNPFYCSVAIYFTSLIPQVIKHVKDKEAMDNFHKNSSWPLISCGLGGIMDPIHTLWEAHLMPFKGCDVNQFIETIKEAEEIITSDVIEYLKGGKPNVNEKAYHNLVNSIGDEINKVEECIHDAVMYFIDWILAPTLNKSPKSFQYNDEKYVTNV